MLLVSDPCITYWQYSVYLLTVQCITYWHYSLSPTDISVYRLLTVQCIAYWEYNVSPTDNTVYHLLTTVYHLLTVPRITYWQYRVSTADSTVYHCVKATFTQCTQLTTQLHQTTSNHSLHTQCRPPHAARHGLINLMMGIMMPETCWDRSLVINIDLVASCWFCLFTLCSMLLYWLL